MAKHAVLQLIHGLLYYELVKATGQDKAAPGIQPGTKKNGK
jgi:hypothetical protein